MHATNYITIQLVAQTSTVPRPGLFEVIEYDPNRPAQPFSLYGTPSGMQQQHQAESHQQHQVIPDTAPRSSYQHEYQGGLMVPVPQPMYQPPYQDDLIAPVTQRSYQLEYQDGSMLPAPQPLYQLGYQDGSMAPVLQPSYQPPHQDSSIAPVTQRSYQQEYQDGLMLAALQPSYQLEYQAGAMAPVPQPSYPDQHGYHNNSIPPVPQPSSQREYQDGVTLPALQPLYQYQYEDQDGLMPQGDVTNQEDDDPQEHVAAPRVPDILENEWAIARTLISRGSGEQAEGPTSAASVPHNLMTNITPELISRWGDSSITVSDNIYTCYYIY